MDIPQETDDYLRESIEFSLGLPVSASVLELKLLAAEESQRRIRDQYFCLLSRLRDKDEIIERARAESSMNAQAVKKFVEENQKLAMECTNLLTQCKKWERECSLYDHDREALMDFGNEADERAKQAETRVCELEEELKRLSEDLQFYKHQCEMPLVTTSSEGSSVEQLLIDSLVTTLLGKDEVAPAAFTFLEANSELEVCQRLLKMRNSLSPSTQNVLALVAQVKSLHADKDHLRINLQRAEEEVKLLFEENNILNEENKRMMAKVHKERCHSDSSGKHNSSGSTKGNKRKSSSKMSSPIEKKLDLSDFDSPRKALSPLQYKSPECRMHKK